MSAPAVAAWACTVIGQPVPKARPRLGRNGHTYTPKRTIDAEWTVGWCMKAIWRQEADASSLFGVRIRFYVRPGWRGDVDNLAKLVLDAANGVVWADDRQVKALDLASAVDAQRPRTEIGWWRQRP